MTDHAAAPAMPADATDGGPGAPMPGAAGDTTGKTWLLWCDLESTGLDTRQDEIVEAAFILTDTNLNEITRWEGIFQPSTQAMERLLNNKVVREMHVASGLLNAVALKWYQGCEPRENHRMVGVFGERVWGDMCGRTVPVVNKGDTVYLAGSGVAAFDRPMIRQHMPLLDDLLHYAPIDVGVLKRTWRMWTGQDISDDNDRKTHRAMSDVEGHLNEARLFRAAFKGLAS